MIDLSCYQNHGSERPEKEKFVVCFALVEGEAIFTNRSLLEQGFSENEYRIVEEHFFRDAYLEELREWSRKRSELFNQFSEDLKGDFLVDSDRIHNTLMERVQSEYGYEVSERAYELYQKEYYLTQEIIRALISDKR
jgi:hypothetical protein